LVGAEYEPVAGGGTRVDSPKVLNPEVAWMGDSDALPCTGESVDVAPIGAIAVLLVCRQPVMNSIVPAATSIFVVNVMKSAWKRGRLIGRMI
jgi:hypothetical protein